MVTLGAAVSGFSAVLREAEHAESPHVDGPANGRLVLTTVVVVGSTV